MKRRSEQIDHETSPSSSKRLCCREICTGEKSDDNISIPLDLTVEILKKLPTKSLTRFRCVSKQWSSIIDSRRDFIDSIVTRSLAHPPRDTHLIFYNRSNNFRESSSFIFSSTYPQNLEKESVSTPGGLFRHVRGLILCWRAKPCAAAVYNPTTRQSLKLPEMGTMHPRYGSCLFGYDPLENHYKVVFIRDDEKQFCQVFTLGDPTKKWRNIQCNVELHIPLFAPVCVNGTIYYQARTRKHFGSTCALMSFDVRSEEFEQVEAPKTLMDSRFYLINYRGKLGLMCCLNGVEIWVMKDAEKKQEWSKIIFYEMVNFKYWCIRGVTNSGEIVFVGKMVPRYQTFDVFYYDPKRNSLRRSTMVKSINTLILCVCKFP